MNKVMLTGNLCRDTELRQTNNGTSVASNCVAVQRDFKNANGDYESDFINIVVWGNSAGYLHRNGKKGDRVELVGRWSVERYEDSNGSQQYAHKCVVENIRVLAKQNAEEPKQAEKKTFNEDDLPF